MAGKENISALMDGELVDKALLQELTDDSAMQDTWRNYHLIGDVIRGDVSDSLSSEDWNIAGKVAAALESEPTYGQLDNVVPLEEQPQPQTAKRQLPRWLSQFGQIAIAACVSFAVVLGVQQYTGSDNTANPAGKLPVLQTIPLAGSAEPVSLTRDSVNQHSQRSRIQEQRKEVNALLQDYELQLKLNSEQQHKSNQ
ncbi:RseA family anti-sigma factor [Vibrio salinus]|uniref:RseA family anti-sigma factor n=1 Tax=Vibrio salinus TaxID=2899784 RepID=UPI001E41B052|nr:RseA family anti-sigma factor [Vibrio salinus]MCE0493422.1 anti-sigma E factor [Vibrio salinus]